jgi:hypothetical protein
MRPPRNPIKQQQEVINVDDSSDEDNQQEGIGMELPENKKVANQVPLRAAKTPTDESLLKMNREGKATTRWGKPPYIEEPPTSTDVCKTEYQTLFREKKKTPQEERSSKRVKLDKSLNRYKAEADKADDFKLAAKIERKEESHEEFMARMARITKEHEEFLARITKEDRVREATAGPTLEEKLDMALARLLNSSECKNAPAKDGNSKVKAEIKAEPKTEPK